MENELKARLDVNRMLGRRAKLGRMLSAVEVAMDYHRDPESGTLIGLGKKSEARAARKAKRRAKSSFPVKVRK